MPDRAPIVVAVTGGIGAGKSTFCRLLRACPGVAHLDADRSVRGLLARSPVVARRIAARYGPGVLTAAGAVDRTRLARIVFADRRALRDLERLLHPIVLDRLARRVAALKRRGEVAIVAVEIPLLVETGVPAWCDLVVTVESERELRLQRLEGRGVARAEARRRMARQAGEARRRRAADVVISNNQGREALEAAARRFWQKLTAKRKGHWGK